MNIHTTRYRIWKLIADQPRTQADIVSQLGIPAVAVADVIRRLRSSGHIVRERLENREAIYRTTGVELCPNGTGNVGTRPRPGYRSKHGAGSGTIELEKVWK